MYINTCSREIITKDICNYLSITEDELIVLFQSVKRIESLEEIINNFILEHVPDNQVDEVLFFHFTRRLNSNDDYNGRNLFELLTTENDFSDFLKSHKIILKQKEDRLELYYKDEKVKLNIHEGDACYLRKRLGYGEIKDYCFNGFVLKDSIYKNHYANSLSKSPEFIDALAVVLDDGEMYRDYVSNSKYYLFEYCIPIKELVFDECCDLAEKDKPIYLINKIIQRLYDYYDDSINLNDDSNNPILRLLDLENISDKYFIKKEEITKEMIFN